VRRLVQALMVLFMGAAMLAPVQAEASTTISGVRASVTHTSITVTVKSLGTGWRYRLYASTNKPDIYYSNLSNGRAKHSSLVSRPKMTISNLGYTTRPYWYRVVASKSSYHHTSAQFSIGLRPNTPSGLTVSSNVGQGTSVSWSNGGVTGLTIQRASDSGFTQGVVTYSVRGNMQQFSPSGLANGATYWFRVRAMNSQTPSSWTAPVQAVVLSNTQRVRIATYNLLKASAGSPAAPWSQRRGPAATLLNNSHADVVAVEEGSDWIGSNHNNLPLSSSPCNNPPAPPRQVDDFVSALRGVGANYSLATTEYVPCKAPKGQTWVRGANYILFNPSVYTVVDSWNFQDSTGRYVPWAVLRNVSTGAQFLFVGVHTVVGNTSTLDKTRQTETQNIIQQAQQIAASHGGMSIIYAGDFNSDNQRNPDGPAVAMRAAHASDVEYTAQSVTNHKYNSSNQYQRTPPANSHSIDHVYASPGVSPIGWRLWLNLSKGQFVGTIPSDHNLLTADVEYPY